MTASERTNSRPEVMRDPISSPSRVRRGSVNARRPSSFLCPCGLPIRCGSNIRTALQQTRFPVPSYWGVAIAVQQDKALDPLDIGHRGAQAVLPDRKRIAGLIEWVQLFHACFPAQPRYDKRCQVIDSLDLNFITAQMPCLHAAFGRSNLS